LYRRIPLEFYGIVKGKTMQLLLFCIIATSAIFRSCTYAQVNYPPRFVKIPDKEALFQNLEATKLDCKAEGYPEPTYRWTRNFMEWSYQRNDGRYTKWPNEGTLVFALPGQDDDGMYQCVATNNLGSALSPIVNMRRADLKDFQPSNIRYETVSPGQYIVLKCTVPTSYPPPIVAWSLRDSNGLLYTIKETRRRAVDVDGNLHIAAVSEEDNGLFICTANNIYLRLMKQGERHQLTVKNTIAMESACQVVARSPETQLAIINGTNVHLKCIIACSPAPQYSWNKIGQPDDYVQNSPFLKIINGGTELEISVGSTEVSGTYRCTGRNERSAKYPMIQYSVQVQSAPKFTVEPLDQTIEEYGSHTFRCEATGIPQPIIKWTVNGLEPSSYMDGVRKRLEGNVIYLTNMTIRDAAVFQCNASNSNGYAFTNAFLNVLRDRPAFVLAPQENLTMAETQTVDMHI
jgi:receptor-type tyrosine-protein phosphatase gamma